jgi:hypothetical protein
LLGARNEAVAKPTKHRGKWRARWIDEKGERQSAVFDDYRCAQTELSRHQVEVGEIKRGIRNAPPPERTFGELCDDWLENRAPRKRSAKDDESIIRRHLRPAFGEMKDTVLQRRHRRDAVFEHRPHAGADRELLPERGELPRRG